MTKAEIASEIDSRMSRERMSATPVRGGGHWTCYSAASAHLWWSREQRRPPATSARTPHSLFRPTISRHSNPQTASRKKSQNNETQFNSKENHCSIYYYVVDGWILWSNHCPLQSVSAWAWHSDKIDKVCTRRIYVCRILFHIHMVLKTDWRNPKNKRLMDYEDNEYGENAVEDMMVD